MRVKRLSLICAAIMGLFGHEAMAEETEVRLGWCNPTIDVSAGAPLAAAMEFGWFAKKNVKLTIVPLAGSTDCVLNITTGQVKTAFAAPEAVAIMASKGGDLQYFYTGFNRNMFGVAVPEGSDIKSMTDLKGKRIGVFTMASVGVVIARSMAQAAGLNPDTDISIVVSGAPAQSKALLEKGEVAAVSHWDMIYETIASSGMKMRKLANSAMDNFPSNGFVALRATIEKEPGLLAAVARGYAMGAIYSRDNPEEASRLYFKHFPQARSTGLSLEEDIKRSLPTLTAVVRLWALPTGQDKWGLNNPAQYQAYIDWLKSRGVLQGEISGERIVNNALIGAINDFEERQASKPN
jgi:NitT/TauT family transport system substrate-binding protein